MYQKPRNNKIITSSVYFEGIKQEIKIVSARDPPQVREGQLTQQTTCQAGEEVFQALAWGVEN